MNAIYQYVNKINGHMYIGLSKDPEKRFKRHLSSSFNEKDRDYNLPIHKAIRKYGIENFEFNILEDNLKDEKEMKEREIYWISFFNTYEDKKHYNATPGGDLPGKNTVHKGEEHGRAILTEQDVIFCREMYKKGKRSRDIHNEFFKDKINYSSFLKMWHGTNWKHIMPEVFNENPHKAKYGEKDRDIITALYLESGLNLNQFSKTSDCYVGYGTLWKMIHTPEFYNGK